MRRLLSTSVHVNYKRPTCVPWVAPMITHVADVTGGMDWTILTSDLCELVHKETMREINICLFRFQ